MLNRLLKPALGAPASGRRVQSPTQKELAGRMPALPATANAPDVTLPLRFILTGVLALLAAVGWLVARPEILATYHYNQYVIALTHLVVLGWICTIVMGAMYQLVPVALETRLYSERLARWQFAFHAAGFAGMVWMFWVWNMKQVGHFGSVLAFGVALFVYNLARTLLRVPRWNVVATAVTAALGWFSLTILVGLSIATAKCTYESAVQLSPASPLGALVHGLRSVAGFMARFDQISAMHAHAHLGGVGFFIMMIVGVSYKLVPMFTLSEVQSQRRAVCSVALLNLGLAGSFVTILLRSPWKLAFTLIMVAGLAIYGCELRAILRARKRRPLDWGIKYFLTAVSLLAPLSVLAVVLSWPGLPLTAFTGQLENLYGFLGLIGVISFAILGMLYKILPFLVWFRSYGKEIGRSHVPALAGMYSEKWQVAGYGLFLAGLLATSSATLSGNELWVRLGGALLAMSLATFAVNAGKILSHLVRPRISPLHLKGRPHSPCLAPSDREQAADRRVGGLVPAA
jgi:hypothetical protein